MTGWLILSDRDGARGDGPPGGGADTLPEGLPDLLPAASLVLELAWPLPAGVLLDWRDDLGRALSILHHPQTGLCLFWRDAAAEGGRLHRHLLPGDLRAEIGPGRTGRGVARLTYRWDAPGRRWHMRLDGGDGAELASAMGLSPAVPTLRALAEMAAGRGIARRDGSVLWFAVMEGAAPPARAPWIGRMTPVPTPGGPVPAGLLRRGAWVMTRDAGPMPLRDVRHLEMPSRGSHAAIVLRAPWFADRGDVLVSSDQMVVIGGLETEYLFGEPEVLVSAGALADGRSAVPDNRRAVTMGVSLDLGGHHLIDAGGCLLMTAHHGAADCAPLMPLRAIRDYEAQPLLSLLRRLRPSDAA